MARPVALITGASRGIGKAIALHLCKDYDLVLTCQTKIEALDLVRSRVISQGGRCIACQCDAGNESQTIELFKSCVKAEFGRIDLVVNNAGASHIGLITDMTFQQWRSLMATNLDSLFLTCQEAVPMMVREKSGNIINISSIWGSQGASCEVAYSASKGGVNSFTKALAKELAPSGIRVNAIACGAIDTDMNQWLEEDDRSNLENEIALGRLGKPEEIAEMVAYLASEKASYVTGQIITVDGGM